MIKYQYAYDPQGHIVDVNTLSKQNKSKQDKFQCLSCAKELIAVLGDKKSKHFRHKNLQTSCAKETYLHHLAKEYFYKTYEYCIQYNKPFWIEFSIDYKICDFYATEISTQCNFGSGITRIDLISDFKKISLEAREGSFIPDVLLESENGEKIFIEIQVKHASSKEKIHSRYPIIELLVQSEDFIHIIDSCCFIESDIIHFFNFDRGQKKGWCKGKCIDNLDFYVSLYREAQITFFNVYQNCLNNSFPFFISFEVNAFCDFYKSDYYPNLLCPYPKQLKTFDLTNYFDKILRVNTENCFIPIYALVSSKTGDMIYFYISNQGGKKWASKSRSISFNITHKEDLQVIRSGLLKESSRVQFLNFSKKHEIQKFCHGNCNFQHALFEYYKGSRYTRISTAKFIEYYKSSNPNIIRHEYGGIYGYYQEDSHKSKGEPIVINFYKPYKKESLEKLLNSMSLNPERYI